MYKKTSGLRGRTLRLAGSTDMRGEIMQRAAVEPLERRVLLSGSGEDGAGGPRISIDAPTVVSADAPVTVTVTFTDSGGLQADSFKVNKISVGRGDGHGRGLTLTEISGALSADGTSYVAQFAVAGPNGPWSAADDGSYSVTVNPKAIRNGADHSSAASSAPLIVNLPPPTSGPIDTTPPTAVIVPPQNVTTFQAPGETVQVTFSDNAAIQAASVGVNDLLVTGPAGVLRVTSVSMSPTTDAASIVATFTVQAPGGGWQPEANGTYLVNLVPGSVIDSSGNPVGAAAPASFTVQVVRPTPPVATITPIAPVVAAGLSSETIRVTYTDNVAVDINTIDVNDITVTAPGGTAPLSVTGVTIEPSGSPQSVTAVYTVAAPGGAFDLSKDGTYTVALAPGQVTDTSGTPAAVVSATFAVNIVAPPPPVDTGFSGGVVSSGFVAESAVAGANNQIVLVGRTGDLATGTSQGVVERLNADGSVDLSFGHGGRLASASGLNEAYYAVAMLPDGGVVAAGTRQGDFVLTRFRADGSLDGQFGAGGSVVTDLGAADDTAYAVTVAPDGSIVAAGGSGGSFAFARYRGDGSLDTFFGQRGKALYAMGAGPNVVGGVAIEPDGSIVAAGASGATVALLRLTPDGAEDPSFGVGGALTIANLQTRQDLGSTDHTEGVALQPDGKILVANRTASGHFGVLRLNPDGTPDTTFGTGGAVTANFGGDDDADAVRVQGDGEIIVIGTSSAGGSARIAVAAFGRDGTPDPTFGTGGQFTIDGSVFTNGRAIHIGDLFLHAFGDIQSNGKLVVGSSDGSAAATTSSALRRLNVPGTGLLGQFGSIGRKNQRLTFVNAAGARVTLGLKGPGTGQAYFDGTEVDIVLAGTTATTAVTIKTRGGNGRAAVRDIQADGPLRSLIANTTDLSGTLFVHGTIGKLMIGSLTGTVAASGAIGAVEIAGAVTGAMILSGPDLGADNKLGGAGAAADAFAAGAIGKVHVGGAITASIVAAGLDPVNGVFLDADDRLIGGVKSRIGSISAAACDPATRFVAGAFGQARLPKRLDPLKDARFEIPASA